ncbi:MAG TPA: TetR/AcrR family transcriptional regulator [Herpetosiphonaceae bacterium]|nr:TetR/AcrR family transcriptional regulator [Herpetosiphonaceae bacterium]
MSTLILDRASELFEQKGYAAVAMREICAACGVTKPTLYYYFADKEALYVATLLRRLDGFRAEVAARAPGEPVRARLTRLAASILTQMRTNVDVMMRDMENIRGPEHHRGLGEAFGRELYGPVLAAMAEGISSGELRPGDPALYAKTYLGLLNAFVGQPAPAQTDPAPAPAVQWFALPPPPERAALVMGLLFDGIGGQ